MTPLSLRVRSPRLGRTVELLLCWEDDGWTIEPIDGESFKTDPRGRDLITTLESLGACPPHLAMHHFEHLWWGREFQDDNDVDEPAPFQTELDQIAKWIDATTHAYPWPDRLTSTRPE